jgi:A/G-specific adenine glycosylase
MPGSPPEVAPRHRRAFRQRLLTWYRTDHRPLPWREGCDPYRVLVSEVILQQTRVDQGLPYYERFLDAFPSLEELAEADEQRVLRVWEGLGYYRRARDLQAAARLIRERHDGRIPEELAALEALPGIGPYTAAAIGSIAFGIPRAALDGNALRVFSRVFALSGDPRRPVLHRRIQEIADRLLDPAAPGESNQAVMELGSRVCTPRSPDCPECPLAAVCAARRLGDPHVYPGRTVRGERPLRREVAVALTDRRGRRLLLRRRPAAGLLGGLWEFPSLPLAAGVEPHEKAADLIRSLAGPGVEVSGRLTLIRHAFSHFRLELEVFTARLPRDVRITSPRPPLRWVPREELPDLPFPRFFRKLVEMLGPADRMKPPDPPTTAQGAR